MITYRSLTRWEPGVQLPPGVSEVRLQTDYAIIWRQLLSRNVMADGGFIRGHRVPIRPGDFVMVTEAGTVLVLDPHTAGFAISQAFRLVDTVERQVKTVVAQFHALRYFHDSCRERVKQLEQQRDDLLRAQHGGFRG